MGWDWNMSAVEAACIVLLVAVGAGLWLNAALKIRAYIRGRKMTAICPACGHQFKGARLRLFPDGDDEKVDREGIAAAIAVRLGMVPVTINGAYLNSVVEYPPAVKTTGSLHNFLHPKSFEKIAETIAFELDNVWQSEGS